MYHETEFKDKQVTIIVGASGIGKSAITRKLCTLRSDFSTPTGFTTRDPRPDDAPGSYRYLSHDEVAALAPYTIVQQIKHPDGNLYGTTVDDYGSPVSVIDAMTSSVEDFRHIGFGRVAVFGIIASPPSISERLSKRYPVNHPSRHKRLAEALTCLLWFQKNPEIPLILNDAPTNEPAAREVLRQFEVHTETPLP